MIIIIIIIIIIFFIIILLLLLLAYGIWLERRIIVQPRPLSQQPDLSLG